MTGRIVFSLAGLLLLALVSACASATPASYITPLPTRAQPPDAARNALADVMSELSSDLQQAQQTMAYLAGTPQVLKGSRDECSAFVAKQLELYPQFTQLGATTPTGVLFCDSEQRDRVYSVSDQLYFSRTLSSHQFTVGEFVTGRVTLLPSMGLAYPIEGDNSQLRGVIIAPMKLGWLADRIANIDIPVTGEILILDTYGNVLIHDPDSVNWGGRDISKTEIGSAMLSKIRGSGEYKGADGQTRFYAFDSPPESAQHLLVAVGIK